MLMTRIATLAFIVVVLQSCGLRVNLLRNRSAAIETSYYDNFASLDATKWTAGWDTAYPNDPGASPTANGNLSLAHDATAGGCAIHSANTFDLRDSTASVEVVSADVGAGMEWGIVNGGASENVFGVYTWETAGVWFLNVYARENNGANQNLYQEPMDIAGGERFIRIRHSVLNDTLYLDLSSDRNIWRTVASKAAWGGLSLTSARYYLGMGSNGGAPYSVRFDNFDTTAR